MDMETADHSIDNIVLLREVAKHPMLYNKHHSQHTNVTGKRQLWKQVTMAVFAHCWDEWDKRRKYDAVDEVTKRWQNLRGCFNRELRISRNEQNNSVKPPRRRKYFYYDHMKFLLDCVDSQDDRAEIPENLVTTDADEDCIEIDNFKLIAAVEKHPMIYGAQYESVGVRQQAWESVCEEVLDDWGEWDSKRRGRARTDVQKRWISLRKQLLRHYKIQKQNPRKRTRYVHYDAMKFVLDIWEKAETPEEKIPTSNVEQELNYELKYEESFEDDFEENVIMEYEDSDTSSRKSTKRTRPGSVMDNKYLESDTSRPSSLKFAKIIRPRSIVEPGVEFVDPLHDRMTRARSLDPDLNFALSLVPMLRNLPLSSKLQAQIDILKVFQRFSKSDEVDGSC